MMLDRTKMVKSILFYFIIFYLSTLIYFLCQHHQIRDYYIKKVGGLQNSECKISSWIEEVWKVTFKKSYYPLLSLLQVMNEWRGFSQQIILQSSDESVLRMIVMSAVHVRIGQACNGPFVYILNKDPLLSNCPRYENIRTAIWALMLLRPKS